MNSKAKSPNYHNYWLELNQLLT